MKIAKLHFSALTADYVKRFKNNILGNKEDLQAINEYFQATAKTMERPKYRQQNFLLFIAPDKDFVNHREPDKVFYLDHMAPDTFF